MVFIRAIYISFGANLHYCIHIKSIMFHYFRVPAYVRVSISINYFSVDGLVQNIYRQICYLVICKFLAQCSPKYGRVRVLGAQFRAGPVHNSNWRFYWIINVSLHSCLEISVDIYELSYIMSVGFCIH